MTHSASDCPTPPVDPAADPRTASEHRLMVRIGLVGGVFSAIVCALLLYDYSLRRADNPAETIAFQALRTALRENPEDDELKQQFRQLDLALREDYFRRRAFASVGGVLLLAGVAVTLIAATRAATLNRPLPNPASFGPPGDVQTPLSRLARWGIAAMGVALALTAAGLSLAYRSPLADLDETAARPDADAPSPVAPAAASYPPPSREEIEAAWPAFRGPTGDGISRFTNVPKTWDALGENIRWKTEVPLPGNSSPVVWKNRVFLTGADEERREVFCFDTDSGELLWRAAVPGTPQSTAEPPEVMEDTGFAAPTPVTDGRHVFAMFANGDMAAFDYDGKLAWSHSFGIPENVYGHASSLAMHEGLVFVQLDQGHVPEDEKSRLYAMDAATGAVVWEAKRAVPNSWGSPIVVEHDGRWQVITAADPWVIAYNPADGSELWRARCLRGDCGPTPVLAGGLVQIGNEYCQWSAIRPDGAGDVTETHIAWTAEDGLPDTCSPLATEELVMLMPSTGYFTGLDAKTGEMLWEVEFDEYFASSPSLVGDLMYLFDKEGGTWIGRPTPEGCLQVSEGALGEPCATSPAFQDGRIYIRGETHLFCIEEN